MKRFFLIFSLFLATSVTGQTKTEFQYSTAYKQGTKDILYKEKHEIIYEQDKVLTSKTSYTDVKGRLIAEMQSDYRQSVMMPTCVFRDHRTGASEGLEYRDGRYRIFTESKASGREEEILESTKGVFSCQGWHYYLVDRLGSIHKKGMTFQLVFPARLSSYSFDLRKESQKGDELGLSLAFSNWFIRLFAPRLDLVYDVKKKKILSYRGPSNLMDEKGDMQYVDVIYERDDRP